MRVAWSWLQKQKLRSDVVLITGKQAPSYSLLGLGSEQAPCKEVIQNVQIRS